MCFFFNQIRRSVNLSIPILVERTNRKSVSQELGFEIGGHLYGHLLYYIFIILYIYYTDYIIIWPFIYTGFTQVKNRSEFKTQMINYNPENKCKQDIDNFKF